MSDGGGSAQVLADFVATGTAEGHRYLGLSGAQWCGGPAAVYKEVNGGGSRVEGSSSSG